MLTFMLSFIDPVILLSMLTFMLLFMFVLVCGLLSGSLFVQVYFIIY